MAAWFSNTVIRPWDRHCLVRDISKLLDVARDHEANGLPAGHGHYKTLLAEAETKISAYSGKWGVPVEALHSQFAAVEVLRRLATGPVQGGGAKALMALVLVVLVPILAGGAWGLFHWAAARIGG